ncbi:MAG: response regulator [bacterium]|nr:response regulator [bacterium]MBU1918264.1 response regulator [bacterium]
MMPKDFRVLIIEPSEDVQKQLSSFFEEKKCQVITVADGDQGLKEFQNKPFHIVFSHVDQADTDDLAFLTEIKKMRGDTFVIMTATEKNLTNVLMSRSQGAYDYLFKPLSDLKKIQYIYSQSLVYFSRWEKIVAEIKK